LGYTWIYHVRIDVKRLILKCPTTLIWILELVHVPCTVLAVI
jgi:hypothetical protein